MKEPLARKHGVSALFRPNVHNEDEIVRNDLAEEYIVSFSFWARTLAASN